jgi:K+-sensing histidine kinase KdpD
MGAKVWSVAQRLLGAESASAVTAAATPSLAEVLEADWEGFVRVTGDSSDDGLEGLEDDDVAGQPAIRTVVDRSLTTGTTQLIGNLTTSQCAAAGVEAYRSMLSVPVGERGVLVGLDGEPGQFTAADQETVEKLASCLEFAYDRVASSGDGLSGDDAELVASTLSHDVRNALSVVSGRIELARQGEDIDYDRVQEVLGSAETLLDDSVRLLRTGERIQDETAVELADVARRTWGTVETGDATLETAGDVTISADEVGLSQLLGNLFRNAVQHGGDDMRVRVGQLTDGDGFYVADDGIGIDAEERTSLFEHSHSTLEDHQGLGLYIVARIAAAHGWEIDVTDSFARGARFEITGVEVLDPEATVSPG